MSVPSHDSRPEADNHVTLFLCGDVMTGRGIDQILHYPCEPTLYEPYIKDARGYVELVERASSPLPRPVDDCYIWGDALDVFSRLAPDCRIVNLETAVTRSELPWQGKEIHYRMSPQNIGCLTAAGIDCCALANNHVLDWGLPGLTETLHTLHRAGIQTAGAGDNQRQAETPAVLELPGAGRVLVYSWGTPSSGISYAWAARTDRAGVALLPELSEEQIERVKQIIAEQRQPGDRVVVSIHWGGNWGDEIPPSQQRFARGLIERAGVDIVHGHSSHHVKGIEVYRQRLILYGCGDFLTDYEGISGHEEYRGELALMYFARLEASSGRLAGLELVPLVSERLRLRHADTDETATILGILNREGADLGTRFRAAQDGTLVLVQNRFPFIHPGTA